MNLSIDLFLYVLLFLFAWITSFLLHELMHILGTGKLDGKIIICGFHMYAYPANLLIGGLGAGLIYSSIGCIIMILGAFTVGYIFLIPGIVNIVYGFFEYLFLEKMLYKQYLLGRYSIYCIVTGVMVLIWMVI